MNPNLNNQQQFRLNKINEAKKCFLAEIREWESMSKYIASFDHFDKSLIVVTARSASIFIASFATVIGAPLGIASASFSFAFSMTTRIVEKKKKKHKAKKYDKRKKRKKNHNRIVMWATGKLNSIENKISEALIKNEISHEHFTALINEEKTVKN